MTRPRTVVSLAFSFVAYTNASACAVQPTYPALIEAPRDVDAILFRDVAVFTGLTLDLVEHQDVLVVGERIVDVGAANSLRAPPNAIVVEGAGAAAGATAAAGAGAGATLLPGFVDVHVHLTLTPDPPWTLHVPGPRVMGRSLLWAGVTTALDAAGPLDVLADARARFDDDVWPGPRLVYTGPIVTHEDAYPASVAQVIPWPFSDTFKARYATEVVVDEALDESLVAAAMDTRVNGGASLVKIAMANNPLDAPAFEASELRPIVSAANKRGLRVVAHVDSAEHALAAARAGVAGLLHGVHLGELSVADARELARLNVPVAPTLAVFEHWDRVNGATWEPTPQDRDVWPPELLDELDVDHQREHPQPRAFRPWMEKLKHDARLRRQNVKRLSEAGVKLLVGSDTGGGPATYPGASFHEEMKLMVRAGVPAGEVLLGATSRGAALVAPDGDFGTIAIGKRADLVLVDGNPLDDIRATENIRLVVKNGKLVERAR